MIFFMHTFSFSFNLNFNNSLPNFVIVFKYLNLYYYGKIDTVSNEHIIPLVCR